LPLKYNRPVLITLLLFFVTAFLAGQADPRLEEIDALTRFTGDLSAQYTVKQIAPGRPAEVTVSSVFRRDRSDRFLVVVTAPGDKKGKSYLRQADVLWLFDPRDRQFTFTSAKDRFEASNMRLSDFSGSTWARDYKISATARERLGQFDCRVYTLEARHSGVVFPGSKIWVSDDGLVRKIEDYDLGGTLVRTVAVPSWQRVGDVYLARDIVIFDGVKGEWIDGKFVSDQTVIRIERAGTRDLPDTLFTREYLERLAD